MIELIPLDRYTRLTEIRRESVPQPIDRLGVRCYHPLGVS